MTVEKKYTILFLADGVFALSHIARQLAENLEFHQITFKSVYITSRENHPYVVDALTSRGLTPPTAKQTMLDDATPFLFDLMITLGDAKRFKTERIPAIMTRFHWNIPDAQSIEFNEFTQRSLEQSISRIQKHIDALFNPDFITTFFSAKRHQQLILDNMLDGVMAHTEKRTIFFFNKTAEQITGLKREFVLGQDCHEVFPGRFCGGDCDFCESPEFMQSENSDTMEKRVQFVTQAGQRRFLEMRTLALTDEFDKNIGALVLFKDNTNLETMKSHIRHHHSLGQLITKDPKMLAIFDQIREVANVQASVLIIGESGTGKELVASAIHELSPRSQKPFVAVNCGALPEGILESELFGHEKGAFTGAINEKKGRFELAEKGTLFLDEIAELSPSMQVKLLRALQEKCFERVGGEKLIHVDIRVISATNQDLKQLMKEKAFRRDLFYRLCVVPIELPPLRDRRMDIPVLVEYFLDLVAAETDRDVLGYTSEAMDALSAYAWPGNVRELRNAIEFAYVKSRDSVIKPEHLPPEIITHHQISVSKPGPPLKIRKESVISALSKTNGNRKEAAAVLGIGRATLYRYLEQYGLK